MDICKHHGRIELNDCASMLFKRVAYCQNHTSQPASSADIVAPQSAGAS
jgi:hypothetical protein